MRLSCKIFVPNCLTIVAFTALPYQRLLNRPKWIELYSDALVVVSIMYSHELYRSKWFKTEYLHVTRFNRVTLFPSAKRPIVGGF